jgi:uncharacterized protein YecT (DUF1311 family)
MKYVITVIVFLSASLFGFSQTQLEMNQEEAKKFREADKKLNNIYQQILKEYKSDTAFTKNLKASQKIWIQLRDAEMKMKYPDRPHPYGSVQPMCWAIYKTQLTEERIKTLQVWLDGVEEGDVCSGSVKMKE